MSFASLGLSPALVRAATALGFQTPTPVQAEAIPAILRGADLQAQAPTGSGKSAAYALPLLQRLQAPGRSRQPSVRALVLVPTRELAAQVGELLGHLAQALPQPLKVVTVFGGVSINPQMMRLRGGSDVLVATPGRLLDLQAQRAVRLDALELLVLDEADRLLDAGFAEELGQVLAALPARRQNLLFSATFEPAVQQLADRLLHEPLRVKPPADEAPPPAITQRVIQVDAGQRTELLRHLIASEGWARVLVFVASQYDCQRVAAKLYKKGIYATVFHGGLSQGARSQVLQEFKDRRWDVVVTTDLAARGLDIFELPVVVNYDLPRSATDYVHRIGRTARAGAAGTALSFVSAATEAHFALIEKRQGLRLAREQIAGFEPRERAPATPDLAPVPGTGGVKGKRPSKKDKLRAAAAAAAAANAATGQPGGGAAG